jgi:hypothetical protein
VNRQEQLLKNYILSEIYNIEKESFLLETADLLEEGKIWDWTKSKFSSFKDIFRLSQEDKQKFDSQIIKARREGRTNKAESIEKLKNKIENKAFSNYKKMILSLVILVGLSVNGNLDNLFDKDDNLREPQNISQLAEVVGADQDSIEDFLRSRGVTPENMGPLAAELDAQNPGDNPVLQAFKGIIDHDSITFKGMPPGQSISREAYEQYLAWEFNNERPQGMNMYEHYREFIAAVRRGGEYEKNKEAAIKQRKEDTATQSALLGLDEGTLLYYPEEISALSEDERSTYVDNIIQGLEGDEFMNRYIDAYKLKDGIYDPEQGPIRDTSEHLRSLINNPAISRDQNKKLKGVYANYYMMSNACQFLNDPRYLPIDELSDYVNPNDFKGIYDYTKALYTSFNSEE